MSQEVAIVVGAVFLVLVVINIFFGAARGVARLILHILTWPFRFLWRLIFH